MMKRRMRLNLLSLSLLGIIFFGFLCTAVSASTTYQLGLTKSTDEYTVIQYDDDGWKATINPFSNSKEYFKGDANVTGAKSKQTIKGWVDQTYTTYDALLSLYFSFIEYGMWNNFQVNFTEAEYNETTINADYPNNYSAWYGVSAEWWFTEGEYEETPNNTISPIIIMKDPSDYKLILDNCNALINEILNDTAIDMSIKFFFSNKTADEFLWQLVFYGFGIAPPEADYLGEVVSELACVNTTAIGSTLIFEKTGVTDYTVEVLYGSKGTLSTFIVKDVVGDIIYQITSSNTDWIFYTILISVIACTLAIITYVIVRNRKLKKS
ncbi:MAG: hypothetical protein ACTSR7_12565 [Promethearchaeota archaeon]